MAVQILPWLAGLSTTAKIAGGLTAWELFRQVFGQMSGMREAKTARLGIDLQKQVAEAEAGAAKTATKESRAATRDYMSQLLRMNEEAHGREREREAAQMAMQSRNNQIMMLMQAMQSLPGMAPQQPLATGRMGQYSILGSAF